jgi:hypothetical protein
MINKINSLLDDFNDIPSDNIIKVKTKKTSYVDNLLTEIKTNLINIKLSDEITYKIHFHCSHIASTTNGYISIIFYDNSSNDCLLEIHNKIKTDSAYQGEYIGLIIVLDICQTLDLKNINIYGCCNLPIC